MFVYRMYKPIDDMIPLPQWIAKGQRMASVERASPYGGLMGITYEWRGAFDSAEVSALHAQGFGHPRMTDDWWTRVNRHSLGWVCARLSGELVGFVNVAWDGAAHAFVLDTVVADGIRRRGVGAGLIDAATNAARAAGCEWLHVDFEDSLQTFYLNACGFVRTAAGLVAL